MADGAQPQQPPQLGPGAAAAAAARGMKRESELELPVPGAGADGAEPGLSKRPRTEDAPDGGGGGGGMQVSARAGRPATPGLSRGAPGPRGVRAWKWAGAGPGLGGRGATPAGGRGACGRVAACPRGS